MKLKLPLVLVIYFIGIQVYTQDNDTLNTVNESAKPGTDFNDNFSTDDYGEANFDDTVFIGYGAVKKENLTVPVEQVDIKKVEHMSYTRVENMLQGTANGVFVAAGSGAPNAPVSIRIHGIGTPNNAQPLYVIDGLPVSEVDFWTNNNPQGISFLNPGDIESIYILKDASACAMYGIRGANGVVVINTKKGREGKPVIRFNGYYGNQHLPQNQRYELLNGQEFATLYNEAMGMDIFDPASISSLPTTNWQDKIFRVAPMHNAQLSLSGGSGKGNYYMSFNKYSQKGIIKHSGYDRYSFRINSGYHASDWLKIGEHISLSNSKNQRQVEQSLDGPLGAALQADPTAGIHDDDPDTDWAPMSNTPEIPNPVGVIKRQHNIYTSNRIQGTVFAEIHFGGIADFLEHLKYKLNAGISRSWGDKEELLPAYYESPTIASSRSIEINRADDLNNFLFEQTLKYDFSIQQIHHFNVIGGYAVQTENKEWKNVSYNTEENKDIINSDKSKAEWKIASFISGLQYDFRGKYLLNAAFRHDGMFYFKENISWSGYPAISGAWKLSEEPFLNQSRNINLIKLYFGWGKTGNQNSGLFLYSEYPLVTLEDNMPLLKPEITKSLNTGVDIAMWENKFNASLDVYDKTTTDILLRRTKFEIIEYEIVITDYLANAGEINNKGIDLSLNYQNTGKKNKLKYNIGGHVTRMWSEVIKAEGGIPLTSGSSFRMKMIEDKPIGAFYGYTYEGIFENQEEINNHAPQEISTTIGDMKFKDHNNDGKINDNDQVAIGYAFPDYVYGISAGLSYKNIGLNIFTQGVAGNQIMNVAKQEALYNFRMTTNVSKDLLNYYGRTKDDGSVITDTDVPRIDIRDVNNNNRTSSYFIEDGSYFRIKAITLSYNLPSAWAKTVRLNAAKLYITVQNLYTFSKYSGYNAEIGIDPRYSSNPLGFGVDNAVYPFPRTFLFGIDMKI